MTFKEHIAADIIFPSLRAVLVGVNVPPQTHQLHAGDSQYADGEDRQGDHHFDQGEAVFAVAVHGANSTHR